MILVVALSLSLQKKKSYLWYRGLKILDLLTPAANQELPTCCHGELLSDKRCQGQEQEIHTQEVDVFHVENLQSPFLSIFLEPHHCFSSQFLFCFTGKLNTISLHLNVILNSSLTNRARWEISTIIKSSQNPTMADSDINLFKIQECVCITKHARTLPTT